MAERLLERRAKLQDRIRERTPVGFGKTSLTRSEFRAKAGSDQAFREQMVEEMGVDNFLEMMTEDTNGGSGNATRPV
jgi:hypothetical protein